MLVAVLRVGGKRRARLKEKEKDVPHQDRHGNLHVVRLVR